MLNKFIYSYIFISCRRNQVYLEKRRQKASLVSDFSFLSNHSIWLHILSTFSNNIFSLSLNSRWYTAIHCLTPWRGWHCFKTDLLFWPIARTFWQTRMQETRDWDLQSDEMDWSTPTSSLWTYWHLKKFLKSQCNNCFDCIDILIAWPCQE